MFNSNTISNLLQVEESYMVSYDYFKDLSENNIDVSMRTTLTTWMLEVCEEENCTNEIFSLSVNLFDRLMCVLNKRVEKYHLQLLAIVCLFIAAKLKSNSTLTSMKLIEYTDNSVSLEEFLEWELVVLDKLKWDIAAICPNDYLEIFLSQYNAKLRLSREQMELVEKHSYAFTALCSTDFKFAFYPASMIASACFLTALNGVFGKVQSLLLELASITQTDVDFLQSVKDSVEYLFKGEPAETQTCQEESEKVEQVFTFEAHFNSNVTLDKSFHDEFSFNISSESFFDELILSSKSKSAQKLKNKISSQLKRQSTRKSGRTRG